MATGPYPMSYVVDRVTVEGRWCAGSYERRFVGRRGVVVLSDGERVPCCSQPHGHRGDDALRRCLTRRVDVLNEAAGIPVAAR